MPTFAGVHNKKSAYPETGPRTRQNKRPLRGAPRNYCNTAPTRYHLRKIIKKRLARIHWKYKNWSEIPNSTQFRLRIIQPRSRIKRGNYSTRSFFGRESLPEVFGSSGGALTREFKSVAFGSVIVTKFESIVPKMLRLMNRRRSKKRPPIRQRTR